MKIIIDTNLWISFLIGKNLSVLKTLLSKTDVAVYVCDHLIDEIKKTAGKAKIRKYISDLDVFAVLELIETYCIHVALCKKAISPVRDANDLFLLSLAETVNADFILTGDKDLLSLQTHQKTGIVTYSKFDSLIISISQSLKKM